MTKRYLFLHRSVLGQVIPWRIFRYVRHMLYLCSTEIGVILLVSYLEICPVAYSRTPRTVKGSRESDNTMYYHRTGMCLGRHGLPIPFFCKIHPATENYSFIKCSAITINVIPTVWYFTSLFTTQLVSSQQSAVAKRCPIRPRINNLDPLFRTQLYPPSAFRSQCSWNIGPAQWDAIPRHGEVWLFSRWAERLPRAVTHSMVR